VAAAGGAAIGIYSSRDGKHDKKTRVRSER